MEKKRVDRIPGSRFVSTSVTKPGASLGPTQSHQYAHEALLCFDCNIRCTSECLLGRVIPDSSYDWQRKSKIYMKTLGGGVRDVDAEELLWDVRGMV